MKQKLLIVVLILTICAIPLFSAKSMFKKDSIYLTPKIGLNAYAFNFGLNVEYGLTENIGIGGDVMLAFWSEKVAGGGWSSTLITPSAFAAYHFTQIDVDKLDVFAAVFLGYSIYSVSYDVAGWTWADTASSSFYINPTVGGRYYFTDKIAAYVNLTFAVLGSYTGVGGVVGVTFIVK